MENKHTFTFLLTKAETIKTITENANKESIYTYVYKDSIIIRVPWLLFGVLPVNFQVSFIAKLHDNGESTELTGKFSAPTQYFVMCVLAFLTMWIIFIIKSNWIYEPVLYSLIPMSIMAITLYVFITINIKISRWLFRKQNTEALEFLSRISNSNRL